MGCLAENYHTVTPPCKKDPLQVFSHIILTVNHTILSHNNPKSCLNIIVVEANKRIWVSQGSPIVSFAAAQAGVTTLPARAAAKETRFRYCLKLKHTEKN